MACHILGAPNMALKLGAPTQRGVHQEGRRQRLHVPQDSPPSSFEFPARGNMPPVKLYWYDGLKEQPKIEGVPEGEYLGDLPIAAAAADRVAGRPGAAARRRRAAAGRSQQSRHGFVGNVFHWNDA